MINKYIFGLNPLEEVLKSDPAGVDKIYIRDNLQGNKVRKLQSYASDNRIPVVRVPASKLHDLVGDVNHQGVVASISEITYLEFEDWLDEVDPTFLSR